jgi:hypothetical protein
MPPLFASLPLSQTVHPSVSLFLLFPLTLSLPPLPPPPHVPQPRQGAGGPLRRGPAPPFPRLCHCVSFLNALSPPSTATG